MIVSNLRTLPSSASFKKFPWSKSSTRPLMLKIKSNLEKR